MSLLIQDSIGLHKEALQLLLRETPNVLPRESSQSFFRKRSKCLQAQTTWFFLGKDHMCSPIRPYYKVAHIIMECPEVVAICTNGSMHLQNVVGHLDYHWTKFSKWLSCIVVDNLEEVSWEDCRVMEHHIVVHKVVRVNALSALRTEVECCKTFMLIH